VLLTGPVQASRFAPTHRKWCNVVESGKVVKQVPLDTRQTLQNGDTQQCLRGKWEVEKRIASPPATTAIPVLLVVAMVLLLAITLDLLWYGRKSSRMPSR
jgi:hypothetical protein